MEFEVSLFPKRHLPQRTPRSRLVPLTEPSLQGSTAAFAVERVGEKLKSGELKARGGHSTCEAVWISRVGTPSNPGHALVVFSARGPGFADVLWALNDGTSRNAVRRTGSSEFVGGTVPQGCIFKVSLNEITFHLRSIYCMCNNVLLFKTTKYFWWRPLPSHIILMFEQYAFRPE